MFLFLSDLSLLYVKILRVYHCMKSVRIRSYSVRELFKCGPEKLQIRTLSTQGITKERDNFIKILRRQSFK